MHKITDNTVWRYVTLVSTTTLMVTCNLSTAVFYSETVIILMVYKHLKIEGFKVILDSDCSETVLDDTKILVSALKKGLECCSGESLIGIHTLGEQNRGRVYSVKTFLHTNMICSSTGFIDIVPH